MYFFSYILNIFDFRLFRKIGAKLLLFSEICKFFCFIFRFCHPEVALCALVVSAILLSGCQSSGADYAADVYDTAQLNSKQETKTVNIISVLPAKVKVDNKANKEAAQTFGAVLGAVAGGVAGYWAMVSADRFEEARDYIFAGVEDEYAGLIQKINHYYETVGSKLTSMYKQMEADGVHVSIVAKYGFQLYPIIYNADLQSDMLTTCEQ